MRAIENCIKGKKALHGRKEGVQNGVVHIVQRIGRKMALFARFEKRCGKIKKLSKKVLTKKDLCDRIMESPQERRQNGL